VVNIMLTVVLMPIQSAIKLMSCLNPVFKEGRLQPAHGRTLNPKMRFPVFPRFAGIPLPLFGNSYATSKRYLSVTNKYLAMSTVIGFPNFPVFEGTKPDHFNSGLLHQIRQFILHKGGAVTIQNDAHFHSLFGLVGQCLRHTVSNIAGPVNKSKKNDAVLSLLNSFNHGRENLPAILQYTHVISPGKGSSNRTFQCFFIIHLSLPFIGGKEQLLRS